jgi:hypothetical protein
LLLLVPAGSSNGFPWIPRHDEAVGVLQKAKDLYDRSIGTESPLYGSACERQLVEVVLVEGFSWQLWMCFFFMCRNDMRYTDMYIDYRYTKKGFEMR